MGMIEERTVTLDGVRYRWIGGFGAVIKSDERGVSRNTVRQFGEQQLHAYMVYGPSWFGLRKQEISWTFASPTIEQINAFGRLLFNV
jgi:hypothetical protein